MILCSIYGSFCARENKWRVACTLLRNFSVFAGCFVLFGFINAWRNAMKVRVFRTYLQFDTTVMERYTRKERLLVES